MHVLTRVREARMKLKEQGRSDAKHAHHIADLTERAKTIIMEMNAAKVRAMREAEEPYLEQLRELDEEMSVLITIMS